MMKLIFIITEQREVIFCGLTMKNFINRPFSRQFAVLQFCPCGMIFQGILLLDIGNLLLDIGKLLFMRYMSTKNIFLIPIYTPTEFCNFLPKYYDWKNTDKLNYFKPVLTNLHICSNNRRSLTNFPMESFHVKSLRYYDINKKIFCSSHCIFP